MDLTSKYYVTKRIDGDYAYLILEDGVSDEEKCVARALLPPEVSEGTRLRYENFMYETI